MYRRQSGTDIHTSYYSIPNLNALDIFFILFLARQCQNTAQLLQLMLTGVHVSVEKWRRTILRPDADRDLHIVQ